jgi:hypothetical protein
MFLPLYALKFEQYMYMKNLNNETGWTTEVK